MNFAKGLIAGLACLLTPFALAEPSPSVTKLMNTPVSQFQFGLLQLGEYLRRQDPKGSLNPSVIYDWDANRIVIHLYKHFDTDPDIDKECPSVFNFVRLRGFVDSLDGKPFDKVSTYASFFVPSGYEIMSLEGITAEIDKIILLRATVLVKFKRMAVCEAPLLSTTFTVQRL